ncbi:MAG: hypothetical protein DRN12_04695, partial [Thermoplasmata archaeon]
RISFGTYNDLDVDDDENTGVNGKDIRVQYILLPWFSTENGLSVGLNLVLNIDRLGEEIKNNDFTAYIRLDNIKIGFRSPNITGSEMPLKLQLSSIVFLNLLDSTYGFKLLSNPYYTSDINGKTLSFFATYDDSSNKQKYTFSLKPAVSTDITISSTKEPGVWSYSFRRNSNIETILETHIVRHSLGDTKDTIITIKYLPREISFRFSIQPFKRNGGKILYQSENDYSTEIKIESNNIGRCRYATIKNPPREIYTEWIPSRDTGYLKLITESQGSTSITLQDKLVDPTINISLEDIGNVDFKSYWNLTNPGTFRIIRNSSMNLVIHSFIEEWETRLNITSLSKNLDIKWNINTSGYVFYDTNLESIKTADILIKTNNIGIKTKADIFKAEDFQLNWTNNWNITSSGRIEFSIVSIDVYLNGIWYHIWPWI